MCCDRLATIITLYFLFILRILSVKEIHVLIQIIWGDLYSHRLYGRNKHFFFFSFFFYISSLLFLNVLVCVFYFSSCFSFIMFFVVLLMKHLCSGGKVKKYIYSTTFIWSLESLVSMFGIWLMLNNQLYDNSVIKKVIDPPAERVAPPSSTFTSHQ